MGQVSGTIELNVALQDYVTSGYANAVTFPAALSSPGFPGAKLTYTSGTGANQMDSLYWRPITLAASTPQTFNLQSIVGLGGESLVFARVRELILYNPTTTSGADCKLYQGASNPWAIAPPSTAPLWARANGGLARISDPSSTGAGVGNVVTSTSCEITLDPGANAMTVYLLVGGGSAA